VIALNWDDLRADRRPIEVRGIALEVQTDAAGLCAECDEPLETHSMEELGACAAEILRSCG
jgi:hypothetical protein